MNKIKLTIGIIILMGAFNSAFAADDYMVTAIGGYDAVSYFTVNKAVRGSGFHTATHDGQIFLFSSEKNKDMFKKKPVKYAPQYNGWCAYGASVGKKFHSDPNIFAIVDNKLYLNLDADIQKKWNESRGKKIKAADKNWKKIESKNITSL